MPVTSRTLPCNVRTLTATCAASVAHQGRQSGIVPSILTARCTARLRALTVPHQGAQNVVQEADEQSVDQELLESSGRQTVVQQTRLQPASRSIK